MVTCCCSRILPASCSLPYHRVTGNFTCTCGLSPVLCVLTSASLALQVAAMASLLLQTSPPSRAGSNGADIGAHEASMVASVVCRCSRWVQVKGVQGELS